MGPEGSDQEGARRVRFEGLTIEGAMGWVIADGKLYCFTINQPGVTFERDLAREVEQAAKETERHEQRERAGV